MDYIRTATAHDYKANKANVITGTLIWDHDSEEYVFTPDFMSNAKASYVYGLMEQGIESIIYTKNDGRIYRLAETHSNSYIMTHLIIFDPLNPSEDSFESYVISNLNDNFTVETHEA